MKIKTTNYFRLVPGCLGALFATMAMGQQPDTIFYNGKILTADAEFSIVEAVSMSEGRFTSVGKSSDLLSQAGPNTEKIDLEGKTVIPGLIDNHMHYMRGASRWRFEARIDGVTSRVEALKIIGDKAKEAGPGKWVFVLGGWSEQQFADEEGGFTKEELDGVAPKNPVFLQKSYSRAYMNTLAEKAIGSSSSGSGRMTGGRSSGRGSSQSQGNRLKGNGGKSKGGRSKGSSGARTTINKALTFIPERSEADRVDDIAYFNSYLNLLGLTTVYDVGRGSDGNFDPVKTLAESDKLTMRVFHTLRYQAYNPQEVDRAIQLISSSKPLDVDDWFGLIGLGEHVYNPLHDSTMRSSFFDRSIWGQFERLATAAASDGWHIHEHTQRDTTAEGFLDIAERLNGEYPMKDLRWTVAHCDLISEASIDRAKQLGLTLAVHNKTAKPVVEGQDSPPVGYMQKSGIIWGLGSDSTVVATVNPFHSLWWVTSGKVFPNQVSIKNPVSREDALIAHTRSNAYMMFKEKDLGTIEAGKLADMVVLDRDYLTIPVDEIRDIEALMTVVGGKKVYSSVK